MTIDRRMHEPADCEAASREGPAPGIMVLVPESAPPPMRQPDDVWAMIVTEVDIAGDDGAPERPGEVTWFSGAWVTRQPPADGLYDGDLVVRLVPRADPACALPDSHGTDVEMLLARRGRWQQVADNWPALVAPTAAAVMTLHNDATEKLGLA
ncbi:hypothetical protein [Amycolatopsis sp. NPDC004079]|uniref:hypothetical protein n=1 Tax=Amycolatopsis sp. NPDC004079 TaxID=3154549 RepID=UPI0033B005EF